MPRNRASDRSTATEGPSRSLAARRNCCRKPPARGERYSQKEQTLEWEKEHPEGRWPWNNGHEVPGREQSRHDTLLPIKIGRAVSCPRDSLLWTRLLSASYFMRQVPPVRSIGLISWESGRLVFPLRNYPTPDCMLKKKYLPRGSSWNILSSTTPPNRKGRISGQGVRR